MGHTLYLLHAILHVTEHDFACYCNEEYICKITANGMRYIIRLTVHGCSSQELLFVLLFKCMVVLVMIMIRKCNITS